MTPIKHIPIIICMKWGKPYSADYVNLLRRATKENTKQKHRFVCLTDDTEGLDSDIEALPIPNINLKQNKIKNGGWPKLTVFKQDLHGLNGRALYLDLDVIITGNLDPLINATEKFLIIKEWKRLNDKIRRKKAYGGNSAVFAFDLNQQTKIYEKFNDNQENAFKNHRIEQRFVSEYAENLKYWPEKWCLSFKRQMTRVFPIPPQQYPPKSARIVTFHGKPKPEDVARGGWWGKFPNCGYGTVAFAREYWVKYGII